MRDPSRREILWLRTELNQREEPENRGKDVVLAPGAIEGSGGGVSSPWFFGTLGAEHVLIADRKTGVQLGVFSEATYVHIPRALATFYSRQEAVTVNAGLHMFGMWMLDGSFSKMTHHHE